MVLVFQQLHCSFDKGFHMLLERKHHEQPVMVYDRLLLPELACVLYYIRTIFHVQHLVFY